MESNNPYYTPDRNANTVPDNFRGKTIGYYIDNNWISVILALLAIVLYAYKFLSDRLYFWKIRGVPHIKPRLLFGNFADVIFQRVSLPVHHLNLYKNLESHSYGGILQMFTPMLMIRDPELIKKVVIKDFGNFHDRGIPIYDGVDPLSKQLFMMNGEEWKNLRIKLTMAFSSGKMKSMLPLMEECALQLLPIIEKEGKSGNWDIEIKDLMSRYTTDVIGSCAFGIQIDSLNDPKSEFREKSKIFFDFRIKSMIRSMWPTVPVALIKLFGLTFVTKDVAEFFMSVVKDVVEYREKNKIVRNDFLNILINLKNDFDLSQDKKEQAEINDPEQLDIKEDNGKGASSNVDMTLEVMAAQCLIFLGAGFETTASTMSFFLFEVAQNSEIQERIRQEINEVLERHNHQLSYYALKDMKYLDMVVSETLRKYPPAPFMFRSCTSEYKIEDSGFVIPKGMILIIPVLGLHYDEKYYSNPDEFNPENFSEEAKQKRQPYTYLPFGEGPRICIAERFAKMQVKTGLVHIMKNYTFKLSPKMKLPLEFDNGFSISKLKGGTWLHFEPVKY